MYLTAVCRRFHTPPHPQLSPLFTPLACHEQPRCNHMLRKFLPSYGIFLVKRLNVAQQVLVCVRDTTCSRGRGGGEVLPHVDNTLPASKTKSSNSITYLGPLFYYTKSWKAKLL